MHTRREVLRTAAAVSALSALSTGSASATGRTRESEDWFEPLGSIDIQGARDAAVVDDTAYVAALDGFVVVDISEPTAPAILAECREIETNGEQPLLGIWDVWPSGNRLAVGGPATPADSPNGVALFDITDPAEPEQVAFHPTEAYVHNIYLDGNTLYVTGRDETIPLIIVDCTDNEPRELARWSPLDLDAGWESVEPPLRLLHDIYVHDDIAYLPYWDAGTWMLDVSTPAAPAPLGRVSEYDQSELAQISREDTGTVSLTPHGADHYAQVDETGTLLAVGRETWAFADEGRFDTEGTHIGGASGVDLYDVSDHHNPIHLARIEPPESFDQTTDGWFTTAHNLDIVGDRLYTSWYFGGTQIHDISDPSRPERLAWWRSPREAAFWTAQTTEGAFIASSANLAPSFPVPNGTTEALYVFPDRPGEQPNPPSLTTWPEDLVGPEPDERPRVNRDAASARQIADSDDSSDETGGDAADDDPVGANGPDDADGTDETDRETADDTDEVGSGMTAGVGVAGLGSYLLARRWTNLSNSPDE